MGDHKVHKYARTYVHSCPVIYALCGTTVYTTKGAVDKIIRING